MKKFLIQIVLLLVLIGGALIFFQSNSSTLVPFLPQQTNSKEVTIGDNKIKVEIADTKEKRSKGLGGRESLASDSGMLFIFDKPDKYPFWMKGLKFPLDFIYIRDDRVVDLIPNVMPPAENQKDVDLPIYLPHQEVDKVLEVLGGTIDKLNIKIGDKVIF